MVYSKNFTFEEDWNKILRLLFNVLADCKSQSIFKHRCISKELFLEIFSNLPGVLSQRLFSAFDVDDSGFISLKEFVEGIDALNQSIDTKLDFVYKIYDINNDGILTKEELSMMLSHVPADIYSDNQSDFVSEIVNSVFNNNKKDDTLNLVKFKKIVNERKNLKKAIEIFCKTMLDFSKEFDKNSNLISMFGWVYVGFGNNSKLKCKHFHLLMRESCIILYKQRMAYKTIYLNCDFDLQSIIGVYHPSCLNFLSKFKIYSMNDASFLKNYNDDDELNQKLMNFLFMMNTNKKSSSDFFGSDEGDEFEEKLFLLNDSFNKNKFNNSYLWYLPGLKITYNDVLFENKSFVMLFDNFKEFSQWKTVLIKVHNRDLTNFHEKYEMKQVIGAGQYSTVFNAYNTIDKKKVAVKVILKKNLSNNQFSNKKRQQKLEKSYCFIHKIHRKKKLDQSVIDHKSELENTYINTNFSQHFQTEIAILKFIKHKNIVQMLDIYSTRDQIYLVMEWCSGGDLRFFLDLVLLINRFLIRNSDLSLDIKRVWIPEELVKYACHSIFSALQYLHCNEKNIIHRDIKPENIFLGIDSNAFARLGSVLNINSTSNCDLQSKNDSLQKKNMKAQDFNSTDTISDYKSGHIEHNISKQFEQRINFLGREEEDFYQEKLCCDRKVENLNMWLILNLAYKFIKNEIGVSDLKDEELKKIIEEIGSPKKSTQELLELLKNSIIFKLGDFGFSTILAPCGRADYVHQINNKCRVNGIRSFALAQVGTKAYVAPEILRGEHYTTKADVWSMAVLTYELLSGGYFPSFSSDDAPQRPCDLNFKFDSNSKIHFLPASSWIHVTKEAKEFIEQVMQTNPENRPDVEICLKLQWLFDSQQV